MKNPGEAAPAWEILTQADFAAVDAIGRRIHVDFEERTEVLFDKARLHPPACRILIWRGSTVGYAIAHPWRLNLIPALDRFLPDLGGGVDCLFVHDVAILPEARGFGSAGAYIDMLMRQGLELGLRRLACVSVYGTVPLWSRLGFTQSEFDGMAAQIAEYGPTARYMISGF